MSAHPLQAYGISLGLLLIPVFLWNILLAPYLPAALTAPAFLRELPPWFTMTENGLRLLIFFLPFLMPWPTRSPRTRLGIQLFITGTGLYFASWVPLLIAPNSAWSVSTVGFLAPAYTPGLWLVGLALVSERFFWGRFYRWWMYLVPALPFLVLHVAHVAIIHARFH